ncbi:hypothetical protein EVAR_36066_1 [Eumeta japonica]|uniref:Uncharacterized protein n=1 Tax=Eumeta variegata TaxID=151549 RepID=A0A4C1ZDP6_EUMVA|nr:hypothetical protein EVAR_36066_1 [Eumeta japonica]
MELELLRLTAPHCTARNRVLSLVVAQWGERFTDVTRSRALLCREGQWVNPFIRGVNRNEKLTALRQLRGPHTRKQLSRPSRLPPPARTAYPD